MYRKCKVGFRGSPFAFQASGVVKTSTRQVGEQAGFSVQVSGVPPSLRGDGGQAGVSVAVGR